MKPLAERMRPENLDDMVGQEHLIGKHGSLRQWIDSKTLPSLIFWGPPGVGKTTLARLLAKNSGQLFFQLSAIDSGVKELREVIQTAKKAGGAVLFIDEIHRFNKSQQDALLGAVESGTITLIGATTENPSFEVNAALLSRAQVYVLRELGVDELNQILNHALKEDVELKQKNIQIEEQAALFRFSGGDGRRLLNLLEMCCMGNEAQIQITDERVQLIVQRKALRFDKKGEMHYDVISAFIKSVRGSDPNAAVYYLARMIEAGEEPTFIARRLLILASEDIGNANPTALVLANSCFQAVSVLGYPEARLTLSQTAIYLACSAKSNASYLAMNHAQELINKTGDLPVPLPLRNAPTKLMKQSNYGDGYQYAHDFPGNFVEQEFLPDEISQNKLYEPQNNPRENEMRQQLRKLWKEKYGY